MAALEPYRFEPKHVLQPEDEEVDGNENNERVQGTFFCMQTTRECLCCREELVSKNKMEGTICSQNVVVYYLYVGSKIRHRLNSCLSFVFVSNLSHCLRVYYAGISFLIENGDFFNNGLS